jgi:hypothetical protein
VLVYSSRVPGEFAVISTAYRCVCNSAGLSILRNVTLKFREFCRLHNTVAVNALGLPDVLAAHNCACNSVKSSQLY